MKKSEAVFGIVRVPLDALAVLAALLLSYRLRILNIDLLPGVQLLDTATSLPDARYYFASFVLPGIAVFLALAASLRLYVLRSTMSAWTEMGRVAIASVLWLSLVIAWFFLVKKQLFYSRLLLIHSVLFIILFACAVRTTLILLQRSLLKIGIGRYVTVSLGRQALAPGAHHTLEGERHYRYLGHLRDLEDLRRLSHNRPPDLVLQTDPDPGSEETIALIDYCRSHHLGYGFLPPVLVDVPHLLTVERLGLLPLIRFQPTPLDGWGRVAKRAFDCAASGLLLIALSPVFLLIALAILLTSGLPIFYVSTRVGESGRRQLRVIKFRSMKKNADADKETLHALNHRRDGPLFKIKNDPRITPIGHFLRRWSLDELPQLLNVFCGRMSLVGPRPHLPQEVERYSLRQRRVFAVKPGITGLAQISGRSALTFDEEVKLDLQYIEDWSLLFDLWIVWRTLFAVLSPEGAD